MTVHNYRSRQVHETLNGVNPSSGFRDMRSAKSGSNLWQIWQVFSPWASPYGANGQMSMTVHNYRPRQFHRTSNRENPSSGYRDMGSASLAAARPTARPPGPWRQYPSSPEGWGVKSMEQQLLRSASTEPSSRWQWIFQQRIFYLSILFFLLFYSFIYLSNHSSYFLYVSGLVHQLINSTGVNSLMYQTTKTIFLLTALATYGT